MSKCDCGATKTWNSPPGDSAHSEWCSVSSKNNGKSVRTQDFVDAYAALPQVSKVTTTQPFPVKLIQPNGGYANSLNAPAPLAAPTVNKGVPAWVQTSVRISGNRCGCQNLPQVNQALLFKKAPNLHYGCCVSHLKTLHWSSDFTECYLSASLFCEICAAARATRFISETGIYDNVFMCNSCEKLWNKTCVYLNIPIVY